MFYFAEQLASKTSDNCRNIDFPQYKRSIIVSDRNSTDLTCANRQIKCGFEKKDEKAWAKDTKFEVPARHDGEDPKW